MPSPRRLCLALIVVTVLLGPLATTINFNASTSELANGAIIPISDISGALSVHTFILGGGPVHMVLDVTGYYTP